MSGTLTPAEVRAAAAKLPRVRLAHLPTPLEEATRFAAKLGGGVRVFIKRDDCTGLVLGGNKARHNEFLLADALESGCDMIVWGALVQSNNCRQTAAACAKLGLECRLFLSRAHQKTDPQGNLLLDYLVGARVEFTDAKVGPELYALLAAKSEEFRSAGRKPYYFNPPRVVPLAAVSYALCMAELAEQLAAMNVTPDALYVSSAGATGAGVALGKKLLGLACPARLICPMTGRGTYRRESPTTQTPRPSAWGYHTAFPLRNWTRTNLSSRPVTGYLHPQVRKRCTCSRRPKRF